MRLSLATLVLAGDGPADAPARRAAFARAAAEGFAGVELSPRWCNLRSPATLRAEVADAGLVVSGLNLNRVLPLDRDRIRRAVAAVVELGADVLNLSLAMPDRPTAARPPRRSDDFPPAEIAAAADFVTGLGSTVVVELHDDGPLDTAARLSAFAEQAGVRVNPDLGNIVRNGPADWRAALAALAPRAGCWHVKNYRRGAPAPLADGDIDYAEAVATMQASGFAGWVSVEGYTDDVWQYQRESLAALRAWGAA